MESLASSVVSLDPDGTLNHRPVPALGGVPGFGPQAPTISCGLRQPVVISGFQLPHRSFWESALLMG